MRKDQDRERLREEDERWDLPDEKLDGQQEIADSSPAVRKLDNFWYHYKWTVIIVTFFVVVFVIGLVQILTKEKDDCMILYGGGHYLSESEGAAIEKIVAGLMPGDLNGDGKRVVSVVGYEIYSEEEIRAINGTRDENGNRREINVSYNKSQFDTCNSLIGSGEVAVCFVSPWIYDNLNGGPDQSGQTVGSRLVALSDLFGESLPKGTLPGGDGVRLGDTDLYLYTKELQVLPEDTVICLLKPYVLGSTSKEDYYNNAKTVFKALVSFDAEE